MKIIGDSASLLNEECAYHDRLSESVKPLDFNLDATQIDNCKQCLTVNGPRGATNGVSTLVGNVTAPKQNLVDLESDLRNIHLKTNKCKRGMVNTKKLEDYKLVNEEECNTLLDIEYSRLNHPIQQYRGMAQNRFYDLVDNPQNHIFFDSAVDTRLKTKDEFVEKLPQLLRDKALPKGSKNLRPCKYSFSCDNSLITK